MDNTVTSPTTKGIVLGLILAILGFISFFMQMDRYNPFQYISYFIFLGGIIWSVWYYGKQIAHQGTFGNYFAHGFKTAATITAIMILFFLILMLAFPEFKVDAIEASKKEMASQKGITEEQINQAVDLSGKFFGVFLIGGTMLGYLFFGAVAALIGAGITKKDPTRIAADISQINQ
ncbi:MAG: DUF4199 domain-containing protein [Ginsengibacter sp.]